jgi:hypothetical protein
VAAIDHHDPDRDYPLSHAELLIIGGQKIHLKKEGPHSWWFLNLDKGTLPDDFTGAYTTYTKAYEAALKYCALRKLVIKNGPDLAVTEKDKKRERAMKSIAEI